MLSMSYLVNQQSIDNLITSTISSGKGWSRICLHASADSQLHCMIMCMLPHVSSGMHAHKTKSELITYGFFQNSFEIEILKSNNKTNTIYEISANNPFIALQDTEFRSISNHNDTPVIYIEHRVGPYFPEDITWLD